MSLTAYIEEAAAVSKRAQATGDTDRDALIRCYLLLPISMARKALKRHNLQGHDRQRVMEDVLGEANVALVQAAATFEPSRGHFGAYAKLLIGQAINESVARWTSGGTIRDPRALYAVKNAATERRKNDEPVTASAVAADVGLPVERVRALLSVARSMLYLDTPLVNDDEETTHADLLPDESADTEGQALAVIEANERQELARAIGMLPTHSAVAIGLTTGTRAFDAALVADVLRAEPYHTHATARTQLRQLFQRGQANARALGYESKQAVGPPRNSGRLPSPASSGGTGTRPQRHKPADIWRRLADRWREAARLDAC